MSSPLTTYAGAEAWLLSMTDYERLLGGSTVRYDTRTFDLDHFRDQLRQISDLHLRYAVIHVAGTKGKGSTCAFLESALRHCGIKTGLYTSPHLYKFTERIKINGTDISDTDFCRHIETLRHQMIPGGGDPATTTDQRSFRTVFEILTAAAFAHFAEQQVDVAIVETGLGGRLDSTNVFDQQGSGPLINVITAIGLDHTAILGETLEAIAGEKAGIIRPHARTVVAPQVSPEWEQTVADVVRRRCHAIDAPEPLFAADAISIRPGTDERRHGSAGGPPALCGQSPHEQAGCLYHFQTPARESQQPPHQTSALQQALAYGLTLRPSLPGAHQASNAATALLALVELQQALLALAAMPPAPSPQSDAAPATLTIPAHQFARALTPSHIIAGLEHTTWPGRFQVIPGPPPIIIDGAHCAISADALARTCRQLFGDRPAIIITGFLRDKAGSDLLAAMFRQLPIAHAIAVVPPTPRAVTADHILDALGQFLPAGQLTSADTIPAALAAARRQAASHTGAYIVVFGSLYLVGPALAAAKS